MRTVIEIMVIVVLIIDKFLFHKKFKEYLDSDNDLKEHLAEKIIKNSTRIDAIEKKLF